MAVRDATRVDHIPRMTHHEAMALAERQNAVFVDELRTLEPSDWDKPTDCEAWSVHDIVAHLLGWAELLGSFSELGRQTIGSVRRRSELGNVVDAQNAIQVDDRRDLSPTELIERLERSLPRFVRLRHRFGRVARVVPVYYKILGFTTLGEITDIVFTRDMFIHRVDIARAVGRPLATGVDERRIVHHCVKEWAEGAKPDCRLELTGDPGATFSAGDRETAVITADAIEICRFWSGRASLDVIDIEGDGARAREWLKTRVRF
jgi:uncharacterized protein (TIGR03083 family)